MNIRLIRYADVLLMGAESANEKGISGEAIDYLEQVRARARGTNTNILPKVTTTDQGELREAIRHERRVELGLEFDRFYDLVRWGIAKEVLQAAGKNYQDKNALLPLPQTEIEWRKNMTIKEVSKKYGISQDTLRYYERVNVIPKVTRTSGGIRDYQEEDLRWVELAVCMRNAGLPIESLIEYQRLFRAGDSTIPARLELLNEQMDILQKQKEQIEETMDRLSYKISRYEEAMKTGKLVWTKEE